MISLNIIKNLYEMADSKVHICDKLERNREQIINHLICCYSMSDNNNYNHWKTEIYAMLHIIPKLNTTNKYPSYNNLVKWDLNTWSDSLNDHLRSYISYIEYKENINLSNINKQDLTNYILEYFNWLYKSLSNTGDVTIQEVFNKIDELNSERRANS